MEKTTVFSARLASCVKIQNYGGLLQGEERVLSSRRARGRKDSPVPYANLDPADPTAYQTEAEASRPSTCQDDHSAVSTFGTRHSSSISSPGGRRFNNTIALKNNVVRLARSRDDRGFSSVIGVVVCGGTTPLIFSYSIITFP